MSVLLSDDERCKLTHLEDTRLGKLIYRVNLFPSLEEVEALTQVSFL